MGSHHESPVESPSWLNGTNFKSDKRPRHNGTPLGPRKAPTWESTYVERVAEKGRTSEKSSRRFSSDDDKRDSLDNENVEVEHAPKTKRLKCITIEELRKRGKEQTERNSKPVFLSKEQRRLQAVARLAEKRALEKEEARRKREADRILLSGQQRSGAGEFSVKRESLLDSHFDRGRVKRRVVKRKNGVVGGAMTCTQKPDFEWDEDDDTTRMADPVVDGIDQSYLWTKLRRVRRDSFDDRIHGVSTRHVGPRHWSEKSLKEMTKRDWSIFREDNRITIRGGVFNLARNWQETALPQYLLANIPYPSPSPIQMAAIPIALTGRHLIGLAQTGSGKTAAFVLPILSFLSRSTSAAKHRRSSFANPRAIILAPTRELVNQIVEETEQLTRGVDIRIVGVFGGVDIERQGLELQQGCDVIVATPGRMIDALDRQYVVSTSINVVVLDEADRMVDMGFAPQVNRILEGVELQHVMMFSATMPQEVESIVKQYMNNPITIKIGDRGMTGQDVEQKVEYFGGIGRKRERLADLVTNLRGSMIVFANTKKAVDEIARFIERECGKHTVVLHSSKSQDQRTEGLERFKSGNVPILVATDVLGRGIDIKGVGHVINYEAPSEIAKYTHRIGRTGRAGHKGTAWTLVTKEDEGIFGDLANILERSHADIPQEVLIASRDALKNGYGRAITE